MKKRIGAALLCVMLLGTFSMPAYAQEDVSDPVTQSSEAEQGDVAEEAEGTDGAITTDPQTPEASQTENATGTVTDGTNADGTNADGTVPATTDVQTVDGQTPEALSEEEALAAQAAALAAQAAEELETMAGTPKLQARVHVQTYEWTDYQDLSMDTLLGTSGQAKRLEAIEFRIVDSATGKQYDKNILDVQCSVHVQTYGWQDYKGSGELCGTTGQAKRLEAIKIRLTGSQAGNYSIFYQTHIQTAGWLDITSNDGLAGSSGFSKRMEAMKIALVKNNSNPGIANGSRSFIKENAAGLSTSGHVQTYGNLPAVGNGEILGTTGEAKRMEALTINYARNEGTDLDGEIVYAAHVQTYGWMSEVTTGNFCGTSGEAKRMEAISIHLTGELANFYNIYYRVHAQSVGWMAWTSNGAQAGTTGSAKRLEAIQIKLVPKNTVFGETSSGSDAFMSASRSGLINFVYSKLGTAYVYGGTGDVLTEDEYWKLKRLYGDYVWDSDISKVGQPVVDCSGLIGWYTGIYRDSIVQFNKATEKVPISQLNESMVGWALYKPGHIGIYVGDGYYIAADGSNYGVRKGSNKYMGWTYAIKLCDIIY